MAIQVRVGPPRPRGLARHERCRCPARPREEARSDPKPVPQAASRDRPPRYLPSWGSRQRPRSRRWHAGGPRRWATPRSTLHSAPHHLPRRDRDGLGQSHRRHHNHLVVSSTLPVCPPRQAGLPRCLVGWPPGGIVPHVQVSRGPGRRPHARLHHLGETEGRLAGPTLCAKIRQDK